VSLGNTPCYIWTSQYVTKCLLYSMLMSGAEVDGSTMKELLSNFKMKITDVVLQLDDAGFLPIS
jgi:hypothetical protein